MQSVWILCIFVSLSAGALTVRADNTNVPEKMAENGTHSDTTNMETADTAAKANLGMNKVDEIPREHMGAAEDTKHTALGRTLAAWVGLNSVMEMRDGTSGRLNMILRELRQEKRRLLGQAEGPPKKKQDDSDEDEEEEEEEEEDEEEEEEEEEEAEEEEKGEEEGNGGEEEEEEEPAEEENEAANNSTATKDLLPEECQVEGGLISCIDTGIVDLPHITDLNITILKLPGNNLTTLPTLGLNGMPNLVAVDLSRNLLDDSSINPDVFMNLTLRSLNLDGNGLETIPQLPQSLEELRINDNKINQLLSHNFEGLSNLHLLELRGNILWEGSVEPLAFKPLTMLKHLRLDNNRFTSIPLGLPESLEDLRMSQNQLVDVQDNVLNNYGHLTVLDLSHNLLGENSFHPGAWINLPKLVSLDLSNNQLFMMPSDLPRSLQQLALQHNYIQTIPPNTLSHLQPGLQSLNLSHNQLLEQGLLGKAFRGAYKTLEELILDNNRLERVPVNIRHFTNLHTLRLDHNRISSVPVKSICKVKFNNFSPLLALHLENNYINVNRIPRAAFSCIQEPQRVILKPQTPNEIY